MIGVKWSVFFKKALHGFREINEAWKAIGKDITPEAMRRLQHFLGANLHAEGSLRWWRDKLYGKRYFMAHLLDQEYQETGEEEGQEEVQYTMNAH